jgi:hypothetical protein
VTTVAPVVSPPGPTAEETAPWQRRLAAQANNRAWDLSESASRSPAQSQEMLHAAHAAMHLWSIVGTDNHKAHALELLAHVHALLGNAEAASTYLAACSPYLCGPERQPWEVAMIHAVAANVASATNDASDHRLHYAKARELIDALPDAEDREILEAALAVVPSPP